MSGITEKRLFREKNEWLAHGVTNEGYLLPNDLQHCIASSSSAANISNPLFHLFSFFLFQYRGTSVEQNLEQEQKKSLHCSISLCKPVVPLSFFMSLCSCLRTCDQLQKSHVENKGLILLRHLFVMVL